MEFPHGLRTNLQSLVRSRDGNFGIMTAILLPVLLAAGGMAMDVSNMMQTRDQMQEATDAAALATATALGNGTDSTSAEALGKQFVSGQMANFLGSDAATKAALQKATNVDITTTGDASTGIKYTVAVSSSYALGLTPLMSVLGYQTTNIATGSTSTSGQATAANGNKIAFSMDLALDQSGSMADPTDTVLSTTCTKKNKNGTCQTVKTTYVAKIDALKTAAGSLFDALDKADPTKSLVRIGAISYNNGVTGQSNMNWGTSNARIFVNAMTATGGTDATKAMSTADANIKKTGETDTESKAHALKQNTNVDRYIVLMTDGEMTGNSSTWSATIDNLVRAQCDSAKRDGITVFTVGFMAPPNGISLLKYCASSSSDYYEATSMADLVKAFSSIAKTATQAITMLTK
jgi:Flp pilus assembly protein TadG